MASAKKSTIATSGPLVLHRTYDPEQRGNAIYYVADNGVVSKLAGTKIAAWIDSLDATRTVRLTSLATHVGALMSLHEQGVKLVSTHWHDTKIEKGLEPEAIALAFETLPNEIFKPFVPLADLLKLRAMIGIRDAIVRYRIAAGQKITEDSRAMGFGDDNKPAFWVAAEEEQAEDIKRTETPIEKEIAALAKTIPECIALNQILGVANAWGTAAAVLAHVQDVDRFATVSKLWRYAGLPSSMESVNAARRARRSTIVQRCEPCFESGVIQC